MNIFTEHLEISVGIGILATIVVGGFLTEAGRAFFQWGCDGLKRLFGFKATPPAPSTSELEIDGHLARQTGLTVDQIQPLRETLERTQADLAAMRARYPDWAAEIDKAVQGFNQARPKDTDLALSHIAELIADRRDAQTRELRLAEAVAKHTRAVLVYPYDYAQSAPLLCDAAELAGDRPWYWIDCGRARATLGDLDAAMAAYETARDVAKAGHQARECAAAEIGIADLHHQQGRHEKAEKLYRAALTFFRNAACRLDTSEAWRDLSVSLDKTGDLARARGDHAGAEAAYQESLELRRALAARRDTRQARRDLSVSLNRIGDLARDRGDLAAALDAFQESLAIDRALAAQLDTPEARRDLSVSLDRIGDLARARGDHAGAETPYQESLEIRRALAARRDMPQAQRDLSVSLNRIGDLAQDRGDHAAAKVALQESLELRRALATRLDTPEAQCDLTISLHNMTRVTLATGDKNQARAFYDEGLALIDRLHPDHQAGAREAFAKLGGAFD